LLLRQPRSALAAGRHWRGGARGRRAGRALLRRLLGPPRVQPQHLRGLAPGRRRRADRGRRPLRALAHRGRGGAPFLPPPRPHGPGAGPPVLRRFPPRVGPCARPPRGPRTPEDAVLSSAPASLALSPLG